MPDHNSAIDSAKNPDFATLLERACAGDREATHVLMSLAYEQLRRRAKKTPFVGAVGSTVQPTVLVHELFLQWERQFPRLKEPTEREFYRKMAWLMRGLARDAWKKKQALKRGGRQVAEPLTAMAGSEVALQVEHLVVSDAVTRLEQHSRDLHDAFVMRFVLGMPVAEVSRVLGVKSTLLSSRLRRARAFLRSQVRTNEGSDS